MAFRQSLKSNRGLFLPQMMNLIISSTYLNLRSVISICFVKNDRSILSFFKFCHPPKATIPSHWYFERIMSLKKTTKAKKLSFKEVLKAGNVRLCCWALQHHAYYTFGNPCDAYTPTTSSYFIFFYSLSPLYFQSLQPSLL